MTGFRLVMVNLAKTFLTSMCSSSTVAALVKCPKERPRIAALQTIGVRHRKARNMEVLEAIGQQSDIGNQCTRVLARRELSIFTGKLLKLLVAKDGADAGDM